MTTNESTLVLAFDVRPDWDGTTKPGTRPILIPLQRGCGKDFAEAAIDRVLAQIKRDALAIHAAYTEGQGTVTMEPFTP